MTPASPFGVNDLLNPVDTFQSTPKDKIHTTIQRGGATTPNLTDGRVIQLGKEGLRLIVIKASQKATGRLDRGKQSLDGVLRDRLSWITDGQVDEDRLKQLVGKFNASRRDGDPKVGRAL